MEQKRFNPDNYPGATDVSNPEGAYTGITVPMERHQESSRIQRRVEDLRDRVKGHSIESQATSFDQHVQALWGSRRTWGQKANKAWDRLVGLTGGVTTQDLIDQIEADLRQNDQLQKAEQLAQIRRKLFGDD